MRHPLPIRLAYTRVGPTGFKSDKGYWVHIVGPSDSELVCYVEKTRDRGWTAFAYQPIGNRTARRYDRCWSRLGAVSAFLRGEGYVADSTTGGADCPCGTCPSCLASQARAEERAVD